MRRSKLSAIAWETIGWIIFILFCLLFALFLLGKFTGQSFNLIDKIKSLFGG